MAATLASTVGVGRFASIAGAAEVLYDLARYAHALEKWTEQLAAQRKAGKVPPAVKDTVRESKHLSIARSVFRDYEEETAYKAALEALPLKRDRITRAEIKPSDALYWAREDCKTCHGTGMVGYFFEQSGPTPMGFTIMKGGRLKMRCSNCAEWRQNVWRHRFLEKYRKDAEKAEKERQRAEWESQQKQEVAA